MDGDFVLAAGMIYSAVGIVEGPLRLADVNDEGVLRGSGYDGAVVLIARGVTPFRVIGRLLEDAGAAAVIVYNNRPGWLYGTLSQPSGIPVVSVTEEAGEDLVERLERGEPQALVDVSPPQRSFEGANVIGHRAGPLRRQIVVATPADAPLGDYSNGGNADGLALLLALARHADEVGARHSITFVAFDGTHRGYVGSRWYLAHLSDDERATIDSVLAFDRPGRSRPLQLGVSDELAPLINQRLEADGTDLRVTRDFGVGRGDHDIFAARGVPYVFLTRAGPGEISADHLLVCIPCRCGRTRGFGRNRLHRNELALAFQQTRSVLTFPVAVHGLAATVGILKPLFQPRVRVPQRHIRVNVCRVGARGDP